MTSVFSYHIYSIHSYYHVCFVIIYIYRHFANAVPAIAQRSESIEQIVQYPDGGGELVFSKSFRHSNSPRVSVYEPSRASSSSIPVRTTREEGGSSSGNPKNVKLTGVRSYTNVAS